MDFRDADSNLWSEAVRSLLSISIFLGAFALDGKITTPMQLMRAALIVAPALTFLLLVWFDVVCTLEARPKHNPRFLRLCIAVALAVILLPATMKIMTTSAAAYNWASRAYAADIVVIYLLLGYLAHRLLVLRFAPGDAERLYWQLKRGRRFILAGVFALSLLVPSATTTGVPLREFAWLAAFFVTRFYTVRGVS